MMAKKIKDENGNVYVQKKPFYKRWWFIALVVLVIIGAIGNKDGNDESSSSKTSSNTSITADTTASSTPQKEEIKITEKKEEPTYGIGQLVSVGDVDYTVNSVEVDTNVGGQFGKNAQGVYLLLDVTVANNGDEALSVSDDFFKLYKGKTEFSSDSSAGLYANEDNSFFYNEINPGNAVTGKVVFDINQDVANDIANLQLQVQTGFWGTETERINLK